jgi:RES domain-containing protein
VKVFRARAWYGVGPASFDALDSSGSVAGPKGWRYNDLSNEILYTAEVEALAALEVAIRPGLETIRHILIATIEIPDDSVVTLKDLGITLPSNWNARPVADDSRSIAGEFLAAIAKVPSGSKKPAGLRVPSVLSSSDYNILLDPARKSEYAANVSHRLPFKTLRTTGSKPKPARMLAQGRWHGNDTLEWNRR